MSDRKTVSNSVIASVDAYFVIFWVGKRLFSAVGLVEWAQGFSSAMTLFHDPNINWDSLYLLAIFIMTGLLIGTNLGSFLDIFLVIKHARMRTWNAPAEQILKYIADDSLYSLTLPREERLKEAALAFWVHLKDRKVKFATRKKGGGKLEKASRLFLKGVRPEVLWGRDMSERVHIAKFKLLRENKKKSEATVEYDAVYADWDEVKHVWPPKRF